MTDINVQKANEKTFLVKIWLSKTYFSNFKQKESQVDLNSGCAVHKTNALDHWAMAIYKIADGDNQFHWIFQRPYCVVGQ